MAPKRAVQPRMGAAGTKRKASEDHCTNPGPHGATATEVPALESANSKAEKHGSVKRRRAHGKTSTSADDLIFVAPRAMTVDHDHDHDDTIHTSLVAIAESVDCLREDVKKVMEEAEKIRADALGEINLDELAKSEEIEEAKNQVQEVVDDVQDTSNKTYVLACEVRDIAFRNEGKLFDLCAQLENHKEESEERCDTLSAKIDSLMALVRSSMGPHIYIHPPPAPVAYGLASGQR